MRDLEFQWKRFDTTDFVVNLIITTVVYLSITILLRFIVHQQFDRKDSIVLAILISIFGYIVFVILYFIFGIHNIPKVPVAIFYAYISYLILHDSKFDIKDSKNEINRKDSSKILNSISGEDTRVENKIKRDEVLYEIHKDEKKEEITETEFVKKVKKQNKPEEKIKKSEVNIKTKVNSNRTTNKHLKIITTMFIVTSIVLVSIIVYQIYDNNNLNSKIEKLNNEMRNIKIERNQISKKYSSIKAKANFFDSYAVIIPNNTKVYHKYDCSYCNRHNFIILNTTNAKASGYVACSHCIEK